MRRRAKWMLLLPVILLGLAHADRDADSVSNWRLASRAPVGLAPDPAETSEAVVQVYAARAAHWRGYFGVHTWIAAKPTNAPAFTVYEVTGFQVRRGGPAIRLPRRTRVRAAAERHGGTGKHLRRTRVARCHRGGARGQCSRPDVRPGSKRSGAEAAARRQHRVQRVGHASNAVAVTNR